MPFPFINAIGPLLSHTGCVHLIETLDVGAYFAISDTISAAIGCMVSTTLVATYLSTLLSASGLILGTDRAAEFFLVAIVTDLAVGDFIIILFILNLQSLSPTRFIGLGF